MCVFIMSHTRLEWIYTLLLSACQVIPSSKQMRYLKFKWLQPDSNPFHSECVCDMIKTHIQYTKQIRKTKLKNYYYTERNKIK